MKNNINWRRVARLAGDLKEAALGASRSRNEEEHMKFVHLFTEARYAITIEVDDFEWEEDE